MKYLNLINIILFIFFNFFLFNYYFSDEFLKKKEISRSKYNSFLEKKIDNLKFINSKKNFKEFKDNSNFYNQGLEEKKFWELLKTK
ncbi:hypothetical protein N9317_03480 [Pelagibacteraceae bacterium]|nr:hypothetical protein [Pelagibacteraceae bacterium]